MPDRQINPNLPERQGEPSAPKRSPAKTDLAKADQSLEDGQSILNGNRLPVNADLDKLAGDFSNLSPAKRQKKLVQLQKIRGNAYVSRLVGSTAKTGGAALQRQKPKEPKAKDKSTKDLEITTSNIEDAIKIMWKTYQILVRKRRDAVDQLIVLTEKDMSEPKGFLEDLFLQVLASAILGPTGLIGTMIADNILPSKNLVSKIVGKVGGEVEVSEALEDASAAARAGNLSMGSAINTATSESLKKAYEKVTQTDKGSEDKVRKLFFLSQRTFLSDESDKVDIYFLNHADQYRKLEAKQPGLGIVALKALQESVLSTFDNVAQIQQDASLSQWLIYMARKEAGVHKPEAGRDLGWVQEGTDLGAIMGKGAMGNPTPTRGVLTLEIEINHDNPSAAVTVKRAMLKGVNKAMRERLASKPIEKLGIPIVAWNYDSTYPYFSVGINEGQAVWYSTQGSHDPRSALLYLYFKSQPDTFYRMAREGFKDIDKISMGELTKEAPLAAYTIYGELGKITLDQAKIEITDTLFH
jgi:hypothetical protein